MNHARTNFGRLSTVLVTLLAWFAISNHCALSALVQQTPAAHASCHGSGTSGPVKHSNDKGPCCKSLRATVTSAAKVMPAAVFVAPPAAVPTAATLVLTQREPIGYFADTGPPRSFAELVLQQSVFAHAPPRLA